MDLAILLGCKRNDLYPKIYKDTNKYNHNALTISDILKVLEINYKPEAINLILDRYSLSLKSGICDYRFNRLRVKMKGVE
jgi:hypothetical protein